MTTYTTRHDPGATLLEEIVTSLRALDEVELIWIEGSRADGSNTPCSDIDLRIAVQDDRHEWLLNEGRQRLMACLGEGLLLDGGAEVNIRSEVTTFIRLVSIRGVVIELIVLPASRARLLESLFAKVLHAKSGWEDFRFKDRPHLTPAELWPPAKSIDAELTSGYFKQYLLFVIYAPGTLYGGQLHSARWVLEVCRVGLVEIMYAELGVFHGRRYKHFSEMFPPNWLQDLEESYQYDNARAFSIRALALGMEVIFEKIGIHLTSLSQKTGGGFNAEWYWRCFDTSKKHLRWLAEKADDEIATASVK